MPRSGREMYLNLVMNQDSMNLAVKLVKFHLKSSKGDKYITAAKGQIRTLNIALEQAEERHTRRMRAQAMREEARRLEEGTASTSSGNPGSSNTGNSGTVSSSQTTYIEGPFGPILHRGPLPEGKEKIYVRKMSWRECFNTIVRLQTEFETMVTHCGRWMALRSDFPAPIVRPEDGFGDDGDFIHQAFQNRLAILHLQTNLKYCAFQGGIWCPDGVERRCCGRPEDNKRYFKLKEELDYFMEETGSWLTQGPSPEEVELMEADYY